VTAGSTASVIRNSAATLVRIAAGTAGIVLAAGLALAANEPARSTVPLSPPAESEIPDGRLGDAIRYGKRIVTETRAAAPGYVGNGLRCASCHLDAGRTANAAPLVGLTGLFPEYSARSGRVQSLEDRISDCFERSMNGKAPPARSPEMIGVLAYIAWLSRGVPIGSEVEGRGFRDIRAPRPASASRGKAVYVAKCAGCHGADGQGIKSGADTYAFPPLWGPQSFNAGAGMARLSVAAAFVQAKMPYGSGSTLTEQDAYDVAAYFTTQPRPDFRERHSDWPRGGRPADAR